MMGAMVMRKGACLVALCACVIALVSISSNAKEPLRPQLRFERPWSPEEFAGLADPGLVGLCEEAAVDTYCLVWFDFETNNWQGWTRVDNTAQRGTFFHVDDFAGLGDSLSGGPYAPLEGTKSIWCGARRNAGDPYACGWIDAPGYGHNWSQTLDAPAHAYVGPITISYRISWDSEPDYDYTYFEYDSGNDGWVALASYTGRGDTVATIFMPNMMYTTKLRFRFSSDGAWDDQDGQWDTRGACVIDSIRVSDAGGFSDFEDFESAASGAAGAGMWWAGTGIAFGTYSGLKNGLNLYDKDPCGDNFSTQVVFFVGSTVPSASYPGLWDTPFCSGEGGHEPPCQNEAVVSPIIDTRKYSTLRNAVQDGTIPPGELSSLAGFNLCYTMYADGNPFPNLVNRTWHVRSIVNGCPGPWRSREFIYFVPTGPDYYYMTQSMGDFITGDSIQIALGIQDMCDGYYLVMGDCSSHTPAPWYDNARVYRYNMAGPQWYVRDLDLFQDNFPSQEFDLESSVRADAANDINTNDDPDIRPGDSIVVSCTAPLAGALAADPAGGAAIYMRVKCSYIGPPPLKPALAGPGLQGTCGTYRSDDGVWTIIQGDTARAGGGVQKDRYMFDLNDSLLTRGYMVEYYFTARDADGVESAIPKWARSRGPHYEFTCLPTLNSPFLFVDDFTGRGTFEGTVENVWASIFENVLDQDEQPDRYDVNGPTSAVSNGPGSRAKNWQLTSQYQYIIWDCGDLESATITDGTVSSDKSDDCQMLIDWMNLSEHDCGLWVCGDDVAYDLDNISYASPHVLEFMNTWCGVDFVYVSYYDLTGGHLGGGNMNPLVTGNPAGIFYHGSAPDSFYVYGGCYVMNMFDVLDKTANGQYALNYPDYGGLPRYAGIQSVSTNSGGYDVCTMWFGFSMMYVRDDRFGVPPDRWHLASDVFAFFQHPIDLCCTEATVPKFNRLAQNFPNPFNPATTIRYDLKAKGLVTIKVFDVSGRLVRTLLSGVKDAGSYSVSWDGANNSGTRAASGVYFCRMQARDFEAVKKLVLLK